MPAAPGVPVHETEPIEGATPEAFAALPFIDEGAAEAYAPPPPPPPKKEVTPGEAILVGQIIGGYWRFGFAALLRKHPDMAEGLDELGAELGRAQGKPVDVVGVGHALAVKCGTNCALKYQVALPYLDELVVALALGSASYGLFGKVPANDGARAKAARDANVGHVPGQAAARADGDAPPTREHPIGYDPDDGTTTL